MARSTAARMSRELGSKAATGSPSARDNLGPSCLSSCSSQGALQPRRVEVPTDTTSGPPFDLASDPLPTTKHTQSSAAITSHIFIWNALSRGCRLTDAPSSNIFRFTARKASRSPRDRRRKNRSRSATTALAIATGSCSLQILASTCSSSRVNVLTCARTLLATCTTAMTSGVSDWSSGPTPEITGTAIRLWSTWVSNVPSTPRCSYARLLRTSATFCKQRVRTASDVIPPSIVYSTRFRPSSPQSEATRDIRPLPPLAVCLRCDTSPLAPPPTSIPAPDAFRLAPETPVP
mmetsp:Transcript_21272/g.52534  ORF Transcript_21272/g.52534 Transcript_21272/m.52534 type:complete len:291 (-) Transcript_21272:152-1024(-)